MQGGYSARCNINSSKYGSLVRRGIRVYCIYKYYWGSEVAFSLSGSTIVICSMMLRWITMASSWLPARQTEPWSCLRSWTTHRITSRHWEGESTCHPTRSIKVLTGGVQFVRRWPLSQYLNLTNGKRLYKIVMCSKCIDGKLLLMCWRKREKSCNFLE